jgi:hypothetical protein|tara:strand:+ start:1048 stop:1227 length:180 start_codon:yes stop_codon:yes gene_type:complete
MNPMLIGCRKKEFNIGYKPKHELIFQFLSKVMIVVQLRIETVKFNVFKVVDKGMKWGWV